MKKRFFLTYLWICFFLPTCCYAQQKYIQLKDSITNESVPFAKIFPKNAPPFISDLDGILPLQSTVFSVKAMGYLDTTITAILDTGGVILLRPVVKQFLEVVVLPGVNPAHRIIDLAIENRKKNDPLGKDAFSYNSYSKFVVDMDMDKLPEITDSTKDSTLIRMREFSERQHIFLMESASTRTFIPPYRDKEEITAYKVSGFTDPMLSTFAQEMQSFSFYQNQFSLLGKSYVNPIAFGGTSRYLFVLEDTTYTGRDTTFTIFYRPRKGKNFDGMTGRLYINTNGYAIEKVSAEPYLDSTGTGISILQEYSFIEGRWFPAKLNTTLTLPESVSINGATVKGVGATYIEDVKINPPGLRKRDFDNVSVVTLDGAGDVKEEDWEGKRKYAMDAKEQRTYFFMDSLSKEVNLDKKLRWLAALSSGKLQMNWLALDLSRVLDYNLFEGVRLGLGLETSNKFSKRIVFGAYAAYGTNDQAWKYGGFTNLWLNKQKGYKLVVDFHDDVLERGGTNYEKDNFSLANVNSLRKMYVIQKDRQRIAQISFHGSIRSNMRFTLQANFQRVWFLMDYRYLQNQTWISSCDVAETGLEWRWNIREKVMQIGDKQVPKGSPYPKLKAKFTKGWKGFYGSQFDYWRLHAEVQQTVILLGKGSFNWILVGGQTIGEIPLLWNQVTAASGGNFRLSVPGTFETMLPATYFSTRQIDLFTRFSFLARKTKASWNEPQLSIHHAIGFGENSSSSIQNVYVRSYPKGYYEGGMILNNLLVSKFSAFGVGIFYRYGTYAEPSWQNNFVVKFSLTVHID